MNFFKISLSTVVIFLIFVVLARVFIIAPISITVGQGLRGGFYGLAGMTLVVGIVNIIAIVAVRYLKRWGVILFTLLTVLDMTITSQNIMSYAQFATMSIYVLILVFIWSNYKKFN